ncbi:MAG: bifunctional pyr operon transcriptional regulator/uracil phosphoribosyltransferase PyrR [Saprospiraceae bacterium]|nr:bifunctional pyr operon transcriptional regulator/uracil phosphoribosyltransferase PyrR [Saprospiraceae bacterium]
MPRGKVIIEDDRFNLTIERLCHQLIERYSDFSNTCIIGIQPRGVPLSDRIVSKLKKILKLPSIDYGRLDITFYRDDFRTRGKPLSANTTEMDFLVEDREVILIDDVLYTGRTIQAALTAIQHYGRPANVELLTLIDRRFNRHLPIASDYVGLTIDALDEAYVKVEWSETTGRDRILLFAQKTDSK